MVKSIYLQDGEEIFVDDEDYERVSQHTWTKSYSGTTKEIKKHNHPYHLQAFILQGSCQINKNNDFTRSNLTCKGNGQHWKKAAANSKSKYKGVFWAEHAKKWRVRIKVDGKAIHIGYFSNENDAAKAYNNSVLKYWDGNGYMNVIGEDNRRNPEVFKTNKNNYRIRKNKTGYKGVTYNQKAYEVTKKINNKRVYVDRFFKLEHAALAYNKCVLYLYGDDAILNDVPITDELKEFIANWEIPEKIKQLKDNNKED